MITTSFDAADALRTLATDGGKPDAYENGSYYSAGDRDSTARPFDGTTRWASSDCLIPLTCTGPSVSVTTPSGKLSSIAEDKITSPGRANEHNREAMFTVLPIAVYSSRCCVPILPTTASPRCTPMPTRNPVE